MHLKLTLNFMHVLLATSAVQIATLVMSFRCIPVCPNAQYSTGMWVSISLIQPVNACSITQSMKKVYEEVTCLWNDVTGHLIRRLPQRNANFCSFHSLYPSQTTDKLKSNDKIAAHCKLTPCKIKG